MLLYWIWFAQIYKVPTALKQKLLQHFHDPEEIYNTEPEALAQVEGMTPDALEALQERELPEAYRILSECADKGIGILTVNDEAYPARLRNTADAPVLLYYKGKLPDWEAQPVIGIVGTRKATPYGLSTAARFGKEIAACGGLVISGGAAGIDTLAMEGALEAGKPVVGVLGCGVDVVYPKANKQLFERVTEQGCLLSEYPPRSQAIHWHFPERNRIISGISHGLLVVEAPEKSGAMITARLALEQGRDVFAVPGNVDVYACAGSNALLQERALPALSGWGVIREYELLWPDAVQHRQTLRPLNLPEKPAKSEVIAPQTDKKAIDKDENSTYSVVNNAALSEAEQSVLALIGREPVSMDEIIDRAGMSAGAVKSVLTKLTIKRLISNHPGGRVARK